MVRTHVALTLVCSALGTLLVGAPVEAADHATIRSPGDHAQYVFEAEPHLIVGWGDPFFPNGLPGAGFRGTFHIANGFVKSINDSVGIGVGIDIVSNGRVLVPVVMQWNFWLSTRWSVFAEPGLAIGGGGPNTPVWPVFFFGGRFHFTDRIALTLRIGYPDVSLGVSFLL